MIFITLEKTSLSGTSFPEEMFSTSEIELVETTIAVTNHSTSSITLKETTKLLGAGRALNQNDSSFCKNLLKINISMIVKTKLLHPKLDIPELLSF